MDAKTWLFVGALAGSATTALTALLVSAPTYIPVYVAIAWGLAAAWYSVREAAAARRVAVPADLPAPAAAAVDDGRSEVIIEEAEPASRTVHFANSAAAPAGMRATAATAATAAQPAGLHVVEPLHTVATGGATRSQPADFSWLADLPGAQPVEQVAQDGAPWDRHAVPAPAPLAAEPGPLLPRRFPQLDEYELIWEVLQESGSQNEAIRRLWGAKDGRTLIWIHAVRDHFRELDAEEVE